MSHPVASLLNKPLRGLLVLCGVCLLLLAPLTASSYAVTPESNSSIQTTISQNITTDTTWGPSGNPYYIVNDIVIEPGVTLTIEPGVEMLLSDRVKIHVGREGVGGATVIAKGTPTQNITFTRRDDTSRWKTIRHYAGSTSYYRYTDFIWGGKEDALLFYQGPGDHVLNNCDLARSSKMGLYAVGSGLNLRIAGTSFTYFGTQGMSLDDGANVHITGSDFYSKVNKLAIYLRNVGAPAALTVNDTNIVTEGGGIFNEASATVCVDAEYNWWGAASGPSGGGGGACGVPGNSGSGNTASAGVDVKPYLTAKAPLVGITTPPTATFTVTPDPSTPQLSGTEYTFDASATVDAEDYQSSLTFCWDWENDGGGCDATTIIATHTYATQGLHTASLTVTDTDGQTGTATQDILAGSPPNAAFTTTQTTWAQVEFDASASYDAEDDPADLKAQWDWKGSGAWDTGVYSTTTVLTHEYEHIGRYWPALKVEDTDGMTDTASSTVDIIPPVASTEISGTGGTLPSTDTTIQVDMYTDTVAGTVISSGLVISHTPWITVPTGCDTPPGDFTYNGFNLVAQSLDGTPVYSVTGNYTITLEYDLDYYVDVLGIVNDANLLKLYRWSDVASAWMLVPSTIDSGQLVATTDSFGDFVLISDSTKVYLPLVLRSN